MISKRATKKFDIERSNLKNLFEVEGKAEYEFKISNNFAPMENLDVDMDISRAWNTNSIPKFRPRESMLLQTEAV
jgi:hypothetical protein